MKMIIAFFSTKKFNRVLLYLVLILLINQIQCQQESSLIFNSKKVNLILDEIANHVGSINRVYNNNIQDIIFIDLKMKGDHREINTGTTSYVQTNKMIGYFFYNDLLVVLYSNDTTNWNDLINFDKLKKELPKIYPDQYSDEAFESFDPWGYKLLIHENDSIEIIHKGYF